MERLDKRLLGCFGVTLVLGVILHGLFDFWPCILTEFIAPVNESLWEHVKLIFWPYLLAGLYLTGTGKWRRAPWLLTLLLICGTLLAAGWLLHSALGTDALKLDVSLYLLLMGLAFLLPILLPVGEKWEGLLTGAVILLTGLIICWTIQPPNGALFHDLSLADTFFQLPC
ncbi:MAG: DUF6512 family protein [Candidatus Onthomonas sp.]